MKKIIGVVVLAVIFIGAVIGGGYYWSKKQNEPPPVVEYKNIGEIDADIAKLEPLQKAGKLKWQERYILGVAYLQKGSLVDAAGTLEDVAKLHPDFYKTYESLGMTYYRMDEMEKAVSTWEKAVKISRQAAHLEEMINRAKQRMEFKKRISTLEQEIKQGNTGWQKRFELAALYIGVRRLDDAQIQLEEAVKAKKDSPEMLDTLAQIYAVKGDFDKAIDIEKKAVKLKPLDEDLKKRLAEMEKVRQGIKKAKQ